MVKRFFKKARKAVKKIIPKEIRPALPFIAAAAPIPGIGSLAARGIADQFIKAALVKAATDDEANLGDVLKTGTLAAAPQAIGKGIMKAAPIDAFRDLDQFEKFREGVEIFSKPEGRGFVDTAKVVAGQTGIEQAAKLAEIQQDEIDAYNRKLMEDGIRDKAQRRSAIRNIYLGVGYDEGYVDSMLDRFGYKGGGISYTMDDILDMESEATKKRRKEREEEDEDELSEYIDIGSRGLMSLAPKQKPMPIRPLQMAEGGDVMSPEEYFTGKEKFMKQKQMEDMIREYERYRDSMNMKRDRAAEGGMMNLGGNEMDLRGGGFVPIGKKEKADDVPARLSKNEFVMTADAVRGAGNGDINEGARRMYQTMDKLEAMA